MIINPYSFVSGGGGGFACIAQTGAARWSFTGTITTPSIDTTGADLLVALVSDYLGSGFADSLGNTWTLAVGDSARSLGTVKVFYSKPTSVGSGHTFSWSAFDRGAIAVAAFSGSASSPLDQTSISDADQAGSITPTQSGALVIAGFGSYQSNQSSLNGGFTFLTCYNDDKASSTLAYLIQTTAAATNPTWSPGGSNRTAVLASFLPA